MVYPGFLRFEQALSGEQKAFNSLLADIIKFNPYV